MGEGAAGGRSFVYPGEGACRGETGKVEPAPTSCQSCSRKSEAGPVIYTKRKSTTEGLPAMVLKDMQRGGHMNEVVQIAKEIGGNWRKLAPRKAFQFTL